MKLSKVFLFGFIFTIAISFISCGGSNSRRGGGTKKFTSKTGWKPNDPKGWFFSKQKKKEKAWGGMVFIEGGTFTMGLVKDDVMHDWNNTPVRTHVRSFFIGETETTNYEYREYVTWIKLVFPPSEPNYKKIYPGVLPDTLVWMNKLSRNDIFTEEYFRSPNFDYYPVVGVSWLQAQRYCDWLTDRANEFALMKKGIVAKDSYTNDQMNQGQKHFNTERYKYNDKSLDDIIDKNKVQKESGIKNKNERVQAVNRSAHNTNLVAKFRLPTETEWEYAALALAEHREYNIIEGKDVTIDKIRKKKGRGRGDFQENFKIGRGDYGGIGGWGNDGAAIPCDVKKFPPNDFGLYGMYGNVAEWTLDVYRPIIDEEGNDFNYYRGNIYERLIQNGQGEFQRVDDNTVKFDTLVDGRVIYKGLPGDYDRAVIEDARNFNDGDYRSSLEVGRGLSDSATAEFNFYNSPIRRFRVNDDGRVILEKDGGKRTSEISNGLRVVKGGSWKDTAYWLDPGQRRYLHESESASWIGFRVAQDHLGSETSGRRSKTGSPKYRM